MTYPVHWRNIPEKTLENFRLHCGFEFGGSMTFYNYTLVANVELKQFDGYWEDNQYVFGSEAHYNWFLLRFS